MTIASNWSRRPLLRPPPAVCPLARAVALVRRRGRVSRSGWRDAQALGNLLELAVLVDERTELVHPPRHPVLQALQLIDD